MRVFVSFSGPDRDIKNKLAAALRAELEKDGDEVWDSDEYCVSDFSEECIKAIRESQVFIVLLSASSMSPSSYVISEVIEAKKLEGRGELNIMVYEVDGAPMTERFAFNLNNVSHANSVERMRGEDGIDVTVRKTRRLLDLRKQGKPEKPGDVRIPEPEAITPGPVGYFVEGSRDKVFLALDDAFERSNVICVAQINGYGRKSAVRKYISSRRDKFEKVCLFPYFSGTVREFLLDGLRFKNLGENAVSGPDENAKLMRVHDLLAKLDPGTVLIVPGVIPDGKDPALISDFLTGLECRIVFISQVFSKKLADSIPVVPVDRMENEHLLELFFHYYECSEEERETLTDPLIRFFDYIDGHTKTVELTAANISEEWRYAEEIPGILDGIHKGMSGGETEEISGRISKAVSDVFSFKEFDAAEQQILWIASVLATVPIDERDLIDVLKDAGCFDAQKLRELTERRWIDADRSAHLISIDPFLADVCLSETVPDPKTVDACCEGVNFLYVKYSVAIMTARLNNVLATASRLFANIGCRAAAQFAARLREFGADDRPAEYYVEMRELLRSAEEECAGAGSEKAAALLNRLKISFVSISAVFDPSSDGGTEIAEKLLESFSYSAGVGEDGTALEVPKSFPPLMEIMKKDPRRMIPNFIMFVDDRLLKEDDSLSIDNMNFASMCAAFVQFLEDDYTVLEICRLRGRLAERGCGYMSASEAALFSGRALNALCAMNIAGEETDDNYDCFISCLKEAAAESGDTNGFCREAYNLIRSYTDLVIKKGDEERADDVLSDASELAALSPYIAAAALYAARSVALHHIDNGDDDSAREVAQKALSGKYTEKLLAADDSDMIVKQGKNDADFLKITLEALDAAAEDGDSGPAVYSDYYSQYTAIGDRRLIKRCGAVAEAAEKIDYSGLDADGILEVKRDLCRRAASGEKWESLAPEAFALVSEAGYRVLGYRHHRVQYIGAAAMLDGRVAEIQNGEGKTYTIPLVAFVHSLYGRQSHVLDFSEYLCRRNFGWMRGIYETLGCTVCTVKDYRALINDRENLSRFERADVIYSTVSKAIFMKFHTELADGYAAEYPLRRDVMILDECDRAVDYASSIYSLTSSKTAFSADLLTARTVSRIIKDAGEKIKFYDVEKGAVTLLPAFYELADRYVDGGYLSLSSYEKRRLAALMTAAIRSCFIYEKGKDYFVRERGGSTEIMFEDKFDGTLKRFGRDYSYFLLLKEGADEAEAEAVFKEGEDLDTISLYSFIRGYGSVCGTTATASSVAGELSDYFGLGVFRVPTHMPVKRTVNIPLLYAHKAAKQSAVVKLVCEKAEKQQPVLVVCETTAESEELYGLIKKAGVDASLLNVNNQEDRPWIISNAGMLGSVTLTTALVNRGVDIKLGGDPAELAKRQMIEEGVSPEKLDDAIYGIDPDEGSSKLRSRHRFLTSYHTVRLENDRKRAAELGGLCVIGTSCYSDLRIEQQVIGRCGRQGCPGESHIIYSCDDNSFITFCGDKINLIKMALGDEDSRKCTPRSVFGKTIRTIRENLQTYNLGGADKTHDALCLAPYRELFFAPNLISREKDTDIFSAVRKVVAADAGFEKRISDMRKGKAKRSPFIERLFELKGEFELPETDAAGSVMKTALGIFDENLDGFSDGRKLEVIRELLGRVFNNAWLVFMKETEREFKERQVLKRYEKYVSGFADRRASELYAEAVDDFMTDLINCKKKI